LVLKVNGAEIVQGTVEAAPVVKSFDEVEDGLASLGAGFEGLSLPTSFSVLPERS
jgi:hypothetical protein